MGLAVVAALAGAVAPATAGGAHAMFIMDANTGATLTDQDGNDHRYPASLTKMMTLYLAFEAIEQGRASMKTKIKISKTASNAAPSKLDLSPGDEITLEDAVMALITKSANDVAIAVAEHFGGTEANFAKLMTAKARELGMKSTTFQNASGLPNSNQLTTARDMTSLGVRLYDDFPRYFPLFSTRSYTYNGSNFRNHNTLMLQMPGINGIKTGYTHASGFNLVSSLQVDGKHIIGAIFGGESAGSRNAHMRVALTRAMAKASTVKTRKPVLVASAQSKAAEKKAKPAPVIAAAAPVERAAPVVPAPPALKIEVAKVRTNDLATARRPDTPPVQSPVVQPQTAQVQLAPTQPASPPSVQPVPKPAAFAQASMTTPVRPAAPPVTTNSARLPSSFETQMAGLAQNIQPQQSVTSAAASLPVSLPVEPARPPSSLGAQLAELTGGAKQDNAPAAMARPSYRLNGPEAAAATVAQVPATAAAPSPGFEIQIGAYATAAEADRQLSQVLAQTPVLKAYIPARRSVKLGNNMLHRARFAGFDQAGAQAMCAELIRQKINCLALKGE